MFRTLLIVGSVILASLTGAAAQSASPEAMTAARRLVVTLKIADQYKALLPVLLLNMKQSLVQDRPEIERDYDAMQVRVAEFYAPFYNAMIDSAAALYASQFSTEELREIEAFYRKPVGQKFLENGVPLAQQSVKIGEDMSRKAADELRARLTEMLRQKGHKL